MSGSQVSKSRPGAPGIGGSAGKKAKTDGLLAVLVFPVALFAFGDPFDGLGYALVSCFGAFGFGDPFDVFALAAGAEGCEDCSGFLVGFEGLAEFCWGF